MTPGENGRAEAEEALAAAARAWARQADWVASAAMDDDWRTHHTAKADQLRAIAAELARQAQQRRGGK